MCSTVESLISYDSFIFAAKCKHLFRNTVNDIQQVIAPALFCAATCATQAAT